MDGLDGNAAVERLDRVASGLLHTARDLRRVAEDLQPLTTREVGLAEALETLGRRLSDRHGVAVRTAVQLRDDVPDSVRETIYRIAQESGGNACRHSGAPEVSIAVTDDGRSVRLEVVDTGRGFDPTKVAASHLGVRFLRDHAEWIGGRLTVDSSPGTGTRVRMEIGRPFNPR
jgi:signal transduction histidine kinase